MATEGQGVRGGSLVQGGRGEGWVVLSVEVEVVANTDLNLFVQKAGARPEAGPQGRHHALSLDPEHGDEGIRRGVVLGPVQMDGLAEIRLEEATESAEHGPLICTIAAVCLNRRRIAEHCLPVAGFKPASGIPYWSAEGEFRLDAGITPHDCGGQQDQLPAHSFLSSPFLYCRNNEKPKWTELKTAPRHDAAFRFTEARGHNNRASLRSLFLHEIETFYPGPFSKA